MNIHQLKHILSETMVLVALVLPFAITLGLLVGFVSWMWRGDHQGFQALWITFCTAVGVAPIALRFSCGPDTRVICERCIEMSVKRRPSSDGTAVAKEQRRHPRYRVTFQATFAHDAVSRFGTLRDLSQGGCRVTVAHALPPGVVGKLLIDVPGRNGPLKIAGAQVRWAAEQECGLAFVDLAHDEQQWVDHILKQTAMSMHLPSPQFPGGYAPPLSRHQRAKTPLGMQESADRH